MRKLHGGPPRRKIKAFSRQTHAYLNVFRPPPIDYGIVPNRR
jgi:hypothetical protein